MKPLQPLELPLRGTQLIEASAGTGKTYTITTLLLRLIVERGLGIEQVLVVTFTEAATAELRDRVRRRLRQGLAAAQGRGDDPELTALLGQPGIDAGVAALRLQRALTDFDQAAIFTIHAFCRRMLQENAFESGAPFDAELEADPSDLYDEIAADFWARETYDAPALTVLDLLARKLDAGGLAPRVAEAIARPELELIPVVDDPGDVVGAYTAAFDACRAAWSADAVGALLLDGGALHGGRYRRASVVTWLDEIGTFLADQRPSSPRPPASLQKLTPEALARGTKKGQRTPAHPFFDAAAALLDAGAGFDRAAIALQRRLVAFARAEHRPRKEQRGIQSFDDLLHLLDAALQGPGGGRLADVVRRRYRAALIDEFQDTDPVQYRIFHAIYGTTELPLLLIGDPKQSIYAFRGADIFAYLAAVEDAGDHAHTLDVNWRSDPRLIEAVNAVFDHAVAPFVYDRIDFQPVRARPGATDALRIDGAPPAPLQLRFVPRDGRTNRAGTINKGWGNTHLPAQVAADVARLLAADTTVDDGALTRPLVAGDVAVLVRTNAQAADVQAELRALRIPSVLRSQASVLRSAEATELAQVLAAVAEPGDPTAVRTALATDLLGVRGTALHALRDDDDGWERWVGRFRDWRRSWEHRGVVQLLRELLDSRAAPGEPRAHARLLALPDGERRMTNLLHLGELLHRAALEEHLGTAGLLRWLQRQRARETGTSDAAELRLESDARAVQLVTVHKSKGLQYPVVFAPFLWSGLRKPDHTTPVRFHDPAVGHRSCLDLGSDARAEHVALAMREDLAEGLRLAYVALTRAQHLCVAYWGGFAGGGTSPLGYLLHGDGSAPAALDAAFAGLDDDALRADLDRLAAAAGGALDVAPIDERPPPRYRPDDEAPPALAARVPTRAVERTWRTTSFSRLAASGEPLSPDEHAGRDHDEVDPAAPATPAPAPGPEVALHDFPRGARAGSCVHLIYEDLDFAAGDDDRRALVDARLRGFGFDPDRWGEVLDRAIADTLDTPFDPDAPGFTLRSLPRERRLDEMEFLFPLALHRAGTAGRSADELAALLVRHGAAPDGYAAHLARLDFPTLRGYLRGFVDLVYERDGRWFVVDYKSNMLGPASDDYTRDRLTAAMWDHHYVLQYHLYAVALHRHLRQRIAGYDPAVHWGGVFYLFVRGMHPGHGPRRGVFADRPSPALLDALSGWLDGETPA